jgi:adenylate cyclase class 2
MIEVEVRSRVENFDEIKKNLKHAKFLKCEKQVDKVFGHPMFLDSQNKIIEGGIASRIRAIGDKRTLEFKEIMRKSGGIEIRSELKNLDIGIGFLKKLGFKEAFTISKTREEYSYNNFIISLDSVDKLGDFIEIEKIVDSPEEKENARKECIELLNLIFPDFKIEDKKYGDLMQEIINKGN